MSGRLGQAEGAVAVLEARLAAAGTELDRERGERVTERERADKLAGEVTEIAKKLAELTAAAQARAVSVPTVIVSRRGWFDRFAERLRRAG